MVWQRIGTLSEVMDEKFRKMTGVYLEIFPGRPRRIIYVGTTKTGFGKRPGKYWNSASDGYLKQKHYAFKATQCDDIYALGMQVMENETRKSYAIRMTEMSYQGKLWIPGSESKSGFEKLWEDWKLHLSIHFCRGPEGFPT